MNHPSDTSRPNGGWRGLSLPVFIPAVAIIVVALGLATWYGTTYGADAETAFTTLRDSIGEKIGWWYVLVVTAFLVFAFWAALSKVGNIRLGRDDERPEFSRFSWFAMLFSAGMGIGLVFWGVAEPLSHTMAPPDIAGVEPGSAEAGRAAIGEALFHWGLHAWGIYVVVGLGLAYMTFRRGRPLSIRWLLEPIFGRRLIESWVGHAIDVFAIVGTVFGVATSLGQGALQIQAGLVHLGWFESSDTLLVGLVVLVTAAGTISVVTGLQRGLRWLSNANMVFAAILAVCVLLVGPTVFLLQSLVQNTGEYLQAIPRLMLVTGAGADDGWTVGWTLFNQAWFLSWAPFVGMFIARISRGRTIREFVIGVMLAPTAIAVVWFTIFGSTAIRQQLGSGGLVGPDGVIDTDTSLFLLFEQLPGGDVVQIALSVLAIAVIVLFFVTSADSAALVTDVLAHGGSTETPRTTRVFWSILLGLSGALLLLAGGEAALTVLQVSSIVGAAPLSVIYVLAVVALVRMFRYEVATRPRYVTVRRHATPAAVVATARDAGDDAQMQRGLRELLREHDEATVRRGLRGASATLSGLDTGTAFASPVRTSTAAVPVLAVHDVPSGAVAVDPDDASIRYDEAGARHDPIAGEVFDTPEYAASAVGVEHETEELLERFTAHDRE